MEPTGLDAEGLDMQTQNPDAIWKTLRSDWLILEGNAPYSHSNWISAVSDRRCQLMAQSYPSNSQHLVLIAEPDPQQFLAAFWAALLENWDIALANPKWGMQEWRAVSQQIQPDIIWGEHVPEQVFSSVSQPSGSQSSGSQSSTSKPRSHTTRETHILIPTGGTSGQIKFIHHTWQTLLASVNGFREHFEPQRPIDSYCVLPLYHVSGLMQVMRSLISHGQIAIAPFHHLETDPLPERLPFSAQANSFRALSLVPTQLQRLIQAERSPWLRQFNTVFLGGAPPWPTLLEAAQTQSIPLSLSYGMTETAAMVTALRPSDFLKGDRSSGAPLPHATIHIRPLTQNKLNQNKYGQHQHGRIEIQSPSISTHTSPNQTLLTDDLGYLDTNGQLHLTGRASQTIISGGENISPAEVEAAIQSTGQVKDICVLGIPDSQWGEAVTAIYVPKAATTASTLKAALSQPHPSQSTPLLSRYKHPKHWVPLESLPRNAQGKLNRQALKHQVLTQLTSQSNALAQPVAPRGGESPSLCRRDE